MCHFSDFVITNTFSIILNAITWSISLKFTLLIRAVNNYNEGKWRRQRHTQKKQMKITEMKPKTMKLRDYLTVIFAKVSQKKKHLSKYVTTILGIAELVNIYWIQFWCVLFCSCRVINQVTLDEINEGKTK